VLPIKTARPIASARYWTSEYSHGAIIPLSPQFSYGNATIRSSDFLFSGSWADSCWRLFGAALGAIGKLSTRSPAGITPSSHVSMGLCWHLNGWRVFGLLVGTAGDSCSSWGRVPDFLYLNFSAAKLELLSSKIGVWFIRFRWYQRISRRVCHRRSALQLQVAEAWQRAALSVFR